MYSIAQWIPLVKLYATGQMVRIETFSLCIGSESLCLSISVINWLILIWTWISVANVPELRFKLPFMDSLNHDKACSNHEVLRQKGYLWKSSVFFSIILVSGLSPFIATAYDVLRFSTKSKMKTYTYDKCNNLRLWCLFTYSQLVYRNRSIYCSAVLRRRTSWPIPRRVNAKTNIFVLFCRWASS